MAVILFCIALCTSVIGSICGIGGGVIIKPVLDAMNIMSVSSISFLSGCTVLTMAVISVARAVRGGRAAIGKRTPYLGLGAAAGGVVGKLIFDGIKRASGNESLVGMAQAILLAAVTLATLIYMLINARGAIRSYHVQSPLVSAFIGLVLGLLSSFLGIGGGPINLAVLAFFFSMDAKEAAINSLVIIIISQVASLLQSVLGGSLPTFSPLYLIVMALGGFLGGLLGQSINRRMDAKQVGKLFNGLLIVVIGICVYNIIRFACA